MGKRLTHAEFTQKANNKHNYKFKYPEEYTNENTVIKIICAKHGDTYQKPRDHIKSVHGCRQCSIEASKNTVEDVKKILNEVHNFKYDYSLITSVENIRTEPLKIICKDHGVFEQMYGNHYQGCGCQTCAIERQSLTKEIVFDKIKDKHGDLYDYSQAEYIDYYTPMKIICQNHGEFWQSPLQHLNTLGCKNCLYDSLRITWNEFLDRANKKHNYFYKYPEHFDLKRNTDKVPITCPKHGVFNQTVSQHLSGQKCNDCAVEAYRLKPEEILMRAIEVYGEKLDELDLSSYTSSAIKIKATCLKHQKDYNITVGSYLAGHRCPTCAKNLSKPETIIEDFVKELGYSVERNRRNIINPKELDIYIPELKKAIEFNGIYWHYSDKHFVPGKHANKSNLCRQKGIRLLHIREELWIKDQSKMKEVIMKFLEHK